MNNKTQYLLTASSFNQTMDSDTIFLKTRTQSIEKIQQLADKHYKQAMKYVYRKNIQQKHIKQRQNKVDELPDECTFRPCLRKNKYMRNIERIQTKSKSPKHIQLARWGINHTFLRRQSIIQAQANKLTYSLEKQKQLNEVRVSKQKKLGNKQQMGNPSNISHHKRVKTTFQIPGVNKFYLNQVKGMAAKNNETLRYKGDQKKGYRFL